MELLDRLIEKWFSLGFGAKSPSKTILGVDISSSYNKHSGGQIGGTQFQGFSYMPTSMLEVGLVSF